MINENDFIGLNINKTYLIQKVLNRGNSKIIFQGFET